MLKNSIIYVISSILSAIIPFLLLPILTRLISPEDYGQLAMFTTFTGGIAAFVGLSVQGAANRRYFDEDITPTLLARFNWNCILILFLSTTSTLVILSAFDGMVASYLGIPVFWIYLGILTVSFNFLFNIRLGQWQVRSEAKCYAFAQITNSLVGFALSLLFIIIFHLGVEGRIFGIVFIGVLMGIISILSLKNDELIIFEYNKQDFIDALSFGVPLIPHIFGFFLLSTIDRLVINRELGLEITGIYMVAVSLGMSLNIIFSSINTAYSPWLFGQLKEGGLERKLSIVKFTYLYFIFLIVMSVLAFSIAPSILRLVVGENFYAAADILPIIILGQVFSGMYFMVTNYIFYVKKTKYLSFVTISSGLINFGLLYLLIPSYGIKGAALSFMIANLLRFLATWTVSAKVFEMPWSLRRD